LLLLTAKAEITDHY